MKTLLFHNYKIGRGEQVFLDVDTLRDGFLLSQGLTLIVAPNGYGKTTILQALSGALSPLSGSVELKSGITTLNEGSLYISEYLTFPKFVYPKEWIEFVIQNKVDDEKILELSKKFKFDHKLNSYMGRLSQGERRKVTWMCAHFSNKSLILMDEPLDGLDLMATPVVKGILEEWNKQDRITLMITHQPYEVLDQTNDVLFIKERKFLSVKSELHSVSDFEKTVRKYY